MRTEEEIRAKIASIAADERLGLPPAQVQINAPLALIQVEMEAYLAALRWTLNEEER